MASRCGSDRPRRSNLHTNEHVTAAGIVEQDGQLADRRGAPDMCSVQIRSAPASVSASALSTQSPRVGGTSLIHDTQYFGASGHPVDI